MNNYLNQKLTYEPIIALYAVGVIGALLIIIAVSWDAAWHLLYLVEDFWVAPHLILYGGMFFIFFSSIFGTLLWFFVFKKENADIKYFKGFFVSFFGSFVQLIGGGADFFWHATFGFDPYLFTPSHLVLLSGIGLNAIGILIGMYYIFYAFQKKLIIFGRFQNKKFIYLLMIIILAVIRLDLNAFVYVLVDVWGIAYTIGLFLNIPESFQFVTDQIKVLRLFVSMLYLSFFGTTFLFYTKKLMPSRGYLTVTVGIGVTITIVAGLFFHVLVLDRIILVTPLRPLIGNGQIISNFILLFSTFIIPIFIFDYWLIDPQDNRKFLIGLVLISPFIAFLDGWLSSLLWNEFFEFVPIFIPFIMLVSYLTVHLNLKIIHKSEGKISSQKDEIAKLSIPM